MNIETLSIIYLCRGCKWYDSTECTKYSNPFEDCGLEGEATLISNDYSGYIYIEGQEYGDSLSEIESIINEEVLDT